MNQNELKCALRLFSLISHDLTVVFLFCIKDFPCRMVQKGEAKLLCDEECETFKDKQKKLLSEEDEMRKKGELKAQQVT